MKFLKYIVVIAIVAYVLNGLSYSIKEYWPSQEQKNVAASNGQVKDQDPGKDQELTPEMDKIIKEKAEKAAVVFVHAIFWPFEEAANDVAKRHPELHADDNQVLELDKSWLQLPEYNKPSVEERMKDYSNAVKAYRSQEGK